MNSLNVTLSLRERDLEEREPASNGRGDNSRRLHARSIVTNKKTPMKCLIQDTHRRCYFLSVNSDIQAAAAPQHESVNLRVDFGSHCQKHGHRLPIIAILDVALHSSARPALLCSYPWHTKLATLLIDI